MFNSTSKTYTLKRKILNFTNKISEDLLKPERKFTADMTYGMLASGSCLLTDICDRLHEPIKKINVVDRLSRHLDKGIPASAVSAYLRLIKKQEKDYKSTNVITLLCDSFEIQSKTLIPQQVDNGDRTLCSQKRKSENKCFL